MLEFHDAWGNPIRFIRWAPGFVSDLQPSPSDPAGRHDPFDPLKLEPVAFALYPLIYSAGPDRTGDILHPLWSTTILTDNPQQPALPSTASFISANYYVTPNQPLLPICDPYGSTVANANFGLVGSPVDEDGDGDTGGWADNIHNHLIGQ
jgi:hypothetical protein